MNTLITIEIHDSDSLLCKTDLLDRINISKTIKKYLSQSKNKICKREKHLTIEKKSIWGGE
ncbi:MAG: hypothetical protein ACK4GL_01850 [Flavobacteriales bacterium]